MPTFTSKNLVRCSKAEGALKAERRQWRRSGIRSNQQINHFSIIHAEGFTEKGTNRETGAYNFERVGKLGDDAVRNARYEHDPERPEFPTGC